MNTPGFTAGAGLYRSGRTYQSAHSREWSRAVIQPASIGLRGCLKWCTLPDGSVDDGCVECCFCLARGGRPESCCF
jgi:hypothetical protein